MVDFDNIRVSQLEAIQLKCQIPHAFAYCFLAVDAQPARLENLFRLLLKVRAQPAVPYRLWNLSIIQERLRTSPVHIEQESFLIPPENFLAPVIDQAYERLRSNHRYD